MKSLTLSSHHRRRRFAMIWSLAAGAMDAFTGLLLATVPAFVLGLLHLHPPPAGGMIYLRWVGIFVAAVGLSYAWTRRGGERAETVWAFTALVRILVAAFLAVAICQGALAPLWASVAATDALVALVQILGLRAGWWKGGHG